MIPKPNYLQGEVKPFEIYIRENLWKNKEPLYYDIDDINGDTDWKISEYTLEDILKFYLQPFSPDMITEYFEGWKRVNKTVFDNAEWRIEVYDRCWYYGKKEYGNDGQVIIYLPILTLQHFISDCIRAGIKLQWKEK